ncbi:MAG: ABC transporter ATP-binding protein [Chloroflexi bacterium]|nr:ABC transporter ATP-binding protein [Chloroflexota bacterium]
MQEQTKVSDVKLEEVKKVFGHITAVDSVSLHIKEGEFVSLLGPSGCGKTTTLRMVAGFVYPTEGNVYIGSKLVNDVPPYKRTCGMVFQNYALFPHLSVFENVAFGLRVRGVKGDEIRKRVAAAIELVRMSGYEKQYPKQLSGGQQQRIALARALVIQPGVLLLDEPLSNLDAKLRLQMREEIRDLVKRIGITTVFVTHDQEESLTIADRICVMNNGKMEQVGSATEIYEAPQTVFVATFVGITNLLEGRLLGEANGGLYAVESKQGIKVIARSAASEPPKLGAVAISIRPEKVCIGRDSPKDATNVLGGRVTSKVYLGAIIRYRVAVRDGLEFVVEQQNREVEQLGKGEEAQIWWASKDALVVTHK